MVVSKKIKDKVGRLTTDNIEKKVQKKKLIFILGLNLIEEKYLSYLQIYSTPDHRYFQKKISFIFPKT